MIFLLRNIVAVVFFMGNQRPNNVRSRMRYDDETRQNPINVSRTSVLNLYYIRDLDEIKVFHAIISMESELSHGSIYH